MERILIVEVPPPTAAPVPMPDPPYAPVVIPSPVTVPLKIVNAPIPELDAVDVT
jgi:hypothetical protein